MLTKQEIQLLHKTITTSARPLVFFDDDADGLASYLLIQDTNAEAHGIRAARGPQLTHHFIGFVRRTHPDTVLIIDKPLVDEEFFRQVTTPTLWLDHHDPQAYQQHKQHAHIQYLNPASNDSEDHRPTSYWIQQALQGPIWIAAAGVTADWDSSLLDAFRKEYPKLAPKTNDIQEALYDSKLGDIIRILNFCMKGSTQEIDECIQALTHIKTPQELLNATSTHAKHVQKHVKPILKEYHKQLEQASQGESKQGVYTYVFEDIQTSLVTNVANELNTKIEEDILIIGRDDGTRINFSMRSTHTPLNKMLEEALAHVEGYGGGHENACGGSIRKDHWQEFLRHIQENN